jgi:hypothetical protein
VHTLRYRLKDLDIDRRGRAVLAVVLELSITRDALRAFTSGDRERRLHCESWHNGACVEGQDRRVRVHAVRVKDHRVRERRENGRRQVLRERVFVRAGFVSGTYADKSMRVRTSCIALLSLVLRVNMFPAATGAHAP